LPVEGAGTARPRPLGSVLGVLVPPALRVPQAPRDETGEPLPAKAPGNVQIARTLRTILSPGAEGPDVADVQAKLIALRLLPGPPSGKYDAATEKAVKEFQKSVAIEINGRVGPFTLGHLEDAVAVYGPGWQGPAIVTVQNHLRALGYLRADATGLYDVPTEEAVKEFQADKKLEVNGRVGPLTRQFIAEAMAEKVAIDARMAKHREILARAIAAEARGEPFDTQVAVAATILNYSRMHDVPVPKLVRSSYLSSNYDGNRRFYTMKTGKIPNWDELLRAADEALAGRSRIGNRSHFIDDSIGAPPWVDRKSGLKIGRMIFYRGRTG